MLIMPQVTDTEVGTIIGIDPGTNMLGFSVLRFNLRTYELLSVEGQSFKSEAMIESDDFISITHNERIAKIYAQKNNLVQLLRFYNPMAVTCEHPFINRFRPNAYGPLVEILFAIRTACIEFNPLVKFITYEPSVIKKAVGATAFANKDLVKAAILANKELSPNEFTHLGFLDEHALDAIGVAYTHLLRLRKE